MKKKRKLLSNNLFDCLHFVTLFVDFGMIRQLFCILQYDHTFDHEYPVEGTYTLTVNTSNAVSHALISRNIVVENPIRGERDTISTSLVILNLVPVHIYRNRIINFV